MDEVLIHQQTCRTIDCARGQGGSGRRIFWVKCRSFGIIKSASEMSDLDGVMSLSLFFSPFLSTYPLSLFIISSFFLVVPPPPHHFGRGNCLLCANPPPIGYAPVLKGSHLSSAIINQVGLCTTQNLKVLCEHSKERPQ